MQELDQDNLDQIVKDNAKVMVQYGASWCGICRVMKPKMNRLNEKFEGLTFVYVDAEKFPESRKLAKVDNLPTFAGFANGELVNQVFGSKIETVEELANEVASH